MHQAYVNMASEQGITQEELLEVLEAAITMQDCPGEEWALKAWAAYKESVDGNPSAPIANCCAH
jgi:alkylhydroperoxidase/carboxymuconolactone decarboxylase family protein YurZ